MSFQIGASPIQKIQDDWLNENGVELFIKRDDLLHPQVQGNKWRKLKYNLQQARDTNQNTLLTFGGVYSNHIYATAAAAKLFGFKSIGIIRGEDAPVLTSTLQFAKQMGMELHYFNREKYRRKYEPEIIEELKKTFSPFYLIPEGGTNLFALQGVEEIVSEIDIPYSHICAPVGTGGTLAGLVAGLKGEKELIGFSSLKGEDTLTTEVNRLVKEYTGSTFNNFSINMNYHFGGYAKVNAELIDFIKEFKQKHNIQLEPVYTGKMMYGIYDLIRKGFFAKGSRIIALHTGGLQGLSGYSQYFS